MRVSPVRTCNCNYLKKEGASAIDERKKERRSEHDASHKCGRKEKCQKNCLVEKLKAKNVQSICQ